MREVSERRQRRQPAGAMHIITVAHALLGIASLLARRRCLIDSTVRSYAGLRRQHSCHLPMDRVRDCRKEWGWLEALSARTLRAAHGMVRRVRRLRVCEACDCVADREICAVQKVASSAGVLYGCPWSPVNKKGTMTLCRAPLCVCTHLTL